MNTILLLSHSQKSGGAERCLLEAAVGLKKKGYHVVVFIPAQGEINNLFLAAGITTKIISYPWWVHYSNETFGIIMGLRRFLSVIKYANRLKHEIRKLRPHAVLSNTICIPCGALVCSWLKIRHVWFLHEFGKEDHNLVFDFGFFISSKFIEKTSQRVLVNSALVQAKFQRYIESKKFSIVQYNIPAPVINKAAISMSPDKFDLFLVGQVKKTKGQMEAILALEILLREQYDVKLLIIGQVIDTSYFSMLQEYVATRNLKEQVTFISHTLHPFDEVKRFTIGLMCSEFEALGRVTVEYMKAGIPVVGADAGSTSNLLRNNTNGLLYELGNHEQLATKIKKLVNDPKLVEQLRTSAREFAESNFNETAFMEGIITSFN